MLTICPLCILTICIFSYFPFCSEGGIWVLIGPAHGHCYLLLPYFCLHNILLPFFNKGVGQQVLTTLVTARQVVQSRRSLVIIFLRIFEVIIY